MLLYMATEYRRSIRVCQALNTLLHGYTMAPGKSDKPSHISDLACISAGIFWNFGLESLVKQGPRTRPLRYVQETRQAEKDIWLRGLCARTGNASSTGENHQQSPRDRTLTVSLLPFPPIGAGRPPLTLPPVRLSQAGRAGTRPGRRPRNAGERRSGCSPPTRRNGRHPLRRRSACPAKPPDRATAGRFRPSRRAMP